MDIIEHILEDLATSAALTKSNAKDFGLSDFFPYITKLQELIDASDVIKLESFVDQLRWNYVEEITSAYFFDINIILGYMTKLLMIKRKTQFKPEEGSERAALLPGDCGLRSGHREESPRRRQRAHADAQGRSWLRYASTHP